MRIKHSLSTWPPRYGEETDVFVIYDDNWNDYSYRTAFHAVYCDVNGNVIDLGALKIYYYEYDSNRTSNYGQPVSSVIGNEIEQLSDSFCSLGQEISYYQNLKKYLPNDYNDILKRLNDIATQPELKAKFIEEHGVRVSLLRDSSAEKALNEAMDILDTNMLRKKDMSFRFSTFIPYSQKSIELNFNFAADTNMPYRINILIGKNGTGKTQILTNLANALSGLNEVDDSKSSSFGGERPLFDKIVSISYSAFDTFKKRPESKRHGNYVYCGIQSDHGTLSIDELRNNFQNAFDEVKKRGRLDSWFAVMRELVEEEHVDLITRIMNENHNPIAWSSGQRILISTITEALASIEMESILLFDEPELHLHPNAVSNTMRMLYRLLSEFDSYAIFATHSPLIVQETPSRYIQILNRIDNVITIRHPELECFGENITNITNEIFDVKSTESNYKTVLKRLAEKMSYEDILDMFDGKLSMNAMIYLKNC